MVYATGDIHSIVSSELFRYVFPHANVSYLNSLLESDSNLCMVNVQRGHIQQMRTMNMHIPVLM